ncbi:MAG: ribbon-helix-helix domain-containing protein [Candidatus Helarchaeota archaeon]
MRRHINVTLPDEMVETLYTLHEIKGIIISRLVQAALEEYLKKREYLC